MKKYIAAAIIIAVVALSWDTKCDHVYVAVEQPELIINYGFPSYTTAEFKRPPIGKHEEKELVCVKCFDKRKQILEYKNTTWIKPKFDTTLQACSEYFKEAAKEARFITNKQLQK